VTIEKAANDRRMHRCQIEVLDGDVNRAAQYYGNFPTPDLIVVETALLGDELLNDLDALAENCDAGTNVLLLGSHNDIIHYRNLISHGISDYLLKPLTVAALVEAAERIFIDPDQPAMAKVVAFYGAEGGVGASTTAHNIGWALGTRLDEDVTIIDLDLCFGTAAFAYNMEVGQGVEDMLETPDRLDPQLYARFILRHSDRIGILGTRANLGNDSNIDYESLEEVLNFVRQQSGIVLLDLPHIWTDWVHRVLVAADEAVIIGTQDLAALRDLKSIVEMLDKERGDENKVKIILNHSGASKKTEVPVKEFAEAIGSEPVVVVPHDPLVFGQAANNGQMIGDTSARHKAVEAYVGFAKILMGKTRVAVRSKEKKPSFNIFKKKK
jgi:pilus assembly protein CpaE